jgi:aminopeptidase N
VVSRVKQYPPILAHPVPHSLKTDYLRYTICFMLSTVHRLISYCIFAAVTISATAQTNTRDLSYMTSGGAVHPLQAIMDIRHYTLRTAVNITEKSISSSADVTLVLSQSTDTLLLDLAHLYTVTAVSVNKKPVSFLQKNDKIYITGTASFPAGRHTITVQYNGIPPVAVRPPWNGGFTWTQDSSGNPWVAINCQMEGGKIWFPCKDHPGDEPNEGADLFITVPEGLVVAGPGLLQEVTRQKKQQTWHWKTNYTISNYCIVFNVGKYKVISRNYTTIAGNKVPMQFYILEQDTAYAKEVLDIRERDSHVLEKYFGEYPWAKEKIGLAQVPNSGMEHQTMVTYGGKFKYQHIGGQTYSSNLFHEYAHEWWANKVTNKDWAHMWIQEGIATYAEALCYYEMGGEAAYKQIISGHRRNVKNRKPMVQGDAVTEADTYSGGDIYGKGSFFMHSLRYILGDAVFLPTLKKLATDSAYTYDHFATSDDVEQLFSKSAGKNLKPLFDFYLRTTDVLNFTVKETGFQTYTITWQNAFMPLPIDIQTDKGKTRMEIGKEPLIIKSAVTPLVDGEGYYLKKVTIQ